LNILTWVEKEEVRGGLINAGVAPEKVVSVSL